VHRAVEGGGDKHLQKAVLGASYVFADGKPIFLTKRYLFRRAINQVRGPSLFEHVLRTSNKDIRIGLIGSSKQVLSKIRARAESENSNVNIVLEYSPPFQSLEEMDLALVSAMLAESKANLVFIGLGCPKQERFMSAISASSEAVLLGVGAAFDFYSGEKLAAPLFIQSLGLEWLFRLVAEPRRLFVRYAATNSMFLYYLFVVIFKRYARA
jgi:N-acetylglucosaminyldiphosphoundecaprenol N-acetyl-beta-D-mannosaminyltransferase